MHAEAFLDHLHGAMPSRESLLDYGLEDDEIVDIQASYIAPKREGSIVGLASTDEIERLILKFDCSNIEIGLICFHGQLKDHPFGSEFALCEADSLVIRDDGSIHFSTMRIRTLEIYGVPPIHNDSSMRWRRISTF